METGKVLGGEQESVWSGGKMVEEKSDLRIKKIIFGGRRGGVCPNEGEKVQGYLMDGEDKNGEAARRKGTWEKKGKFVGFRKKEGIRQKTAEEKTTGRSLQMGQTLEKRKNISSFGRVVVRRGSF